MDRPSISCTSIPSIFSAEKKTLPNSKGHAWIDLIWDAPYIGDLETDEQEELEKPGLPTSSLHLHDIFKLTQPLFRLRSKEAA